MLKPPTAGRVNVQFGTIDAQHPNGHNGQDRLDGFGTPQRAVKGGRIVDIDYNDPVYGIRIIIKHLPSLTGKRVESMNGHCSSIAVNPKTGKVLKVGDRVKRDQVVSYSGSTGMSTGNHTHFGLRIALQWVDPRRWYGNK